MRGLWPYAQETIRAADDYREGYDVDGVEETRDDDESETDLLYPLAARTNQVAWRVATGDRAVTAIVAAGLGVAFTIAIAVPTPEPRARPRAQLIVPIRIVATRRAVAAIIIARRQVASSIAHAIPTPARRAHEWALVHEAPSTNRRRP